MLTIRHSGAMFNYTFIIHEYSSCLTLAPKCKWPVCWVYFDSIPRNDALVVRLCALILLATYTKEIGSRPNQICQDVDWHP